MKMTKVALAAVALLASTAALADVTVSGIFDVGVGHYTGRGTYMEQGAWADHSSITFAGSEDLGSGLKAVFTLEAGFDQNGYVANGGNGNLFSRQSFVGLSSEQLGSVTLGQQLSPFILAQALTNQGVGNFWVNRAIMAGGLNSVAVGGTMGGFFQKNAIQYVSPSVAGFQLRAETTTKTGHKQGTGAIPAQDPADQYTSFSVNGAIAGANVWIATQDRKNTYKSWTVGATYQLTDELNVSANYVDHKDDGATTVKSYALGATYKVAPAVRVIGQYARNDLDNAQTLWNLAAAYDFSKRTSAYVNYGRATNGAISAIGARADYATTGASNNTFGVGVAHSF